MQIAAYIGERVRDAVAVLRTAVSIEGTRQELTSLLAAAAPPRLGPRDQNGMLRAVSGFLGVR